MDSQERIDLEAMLGRVKTLKLDAFDYMEQLYRLPAEMLKHHGHASVEAACLYTLKDKLQEIAKLHKAHIRKYPD